MISVDEALARVVAGTTRLPAEMVALDHADGRVLAADLTSPLTLPPFVNSAMDGYALRAADVARATSEQPVRLTIIEAIAAGTVGAATIGPGQAARIMTGAPIPAGADAVIKYEDVTVPAPDVVAIATPISVGNCIRAPGEDVRAGATVATAGMILSPAHLGLFAALGLAEVACVRRPRIALLSTGDELVPPGSPLTAGHIYDSNSVMLATMLRRFGAEVVCQATTADRLGAVRESIAQAIATQVDLIVTSGGISTGDFDLVKDALALDGHIDFWQILMRPGKPLAFGEIGATPLIGLPGNPIAAFVGGMLFVRAHLCQLQGHDPALPLMEAICAEPIRNGSHKRHFLRGVLTAREGQLQVRLAGGQLPNQFSTIAQSNCLIVAHESREWYAAGERIPVLPLNDVMGGC